MLDASHSDCLQDDTNYTPYSNKYQVHIAPVHSKNDTVAASSPPKQSKPITALTTRTPLTVTHSHTSRVSPLTRNPHAPLGLSLSRGLHLAKGSGPGSVFRTQPKGRDGVQRRRGVDGGAASGRSDGANNVVVFRTSEVAPSGMGTCIKMFANQAPKRQFSSAARVGTRP